MGVIVKNNVAKYSARVEAGVAAAVASTVNDIESWSQRLVPVDTGLLRSSVRTEQSSKVGEHSGKVHYETDYALYVELGTRKMAAQPYLIPAVQNAKRAFLLKLKAAL